MRTEFFIEKAAHNRNREMVHAVMYDEGVVVVDGWCELHRLQPESPTGIFGIIDTLKRTAAIRIHVQGGSE
jgi:hypothetical protein